jgi:hypothetical protein|tara:strand:+ start:283 stop:405 length:123 start_codon:yes stop_codon:yes gene_type:complete
MIDTSCSVFEPIFFGDADTDETIRAIIEHNAKLDALCPPG